MTVLLTVAWVGFIPAILRAEDPGSGAPAEAQEPDEPAEEPKDEPEEDPAEDPGTSAPTPPAARENAYRIGPGDRLSIQVYGEDSLSGEYPVSSSGEMDLPLIGVLEVEGLTTAEVSARVRERLAPEYLKKPHVTTSVAVYASQPVQVLGAVTEPGVYYLKGPTTVLEILSRAGGAETEGVLEIRITRGGESGETLVLPYEQLLEQGADATPIEAGDVVFVPQSLVSVMGEVGDPGELTFREGLTLARAIAAAGGAQPTANLRKVRVLRGDQHIEVNLRRILKGKEEDFPLRAGDQVVVNESVF